jgi:hypothetical protein
VSLHQVIPDNIWWRKFERTLRSLGFKRPQPRLYLQFHSAQTGKLLEKVPINRDMLAMHPTEPLLAVIDDEDNESHLQFWRVPPPKPWGWIITCGLAGGGVAFLLRLGLSKGRSRLCGS